LGLLLLLLLLVNAAPEDGARGDDRVLLPCRLAALLLLGLLRLLGGLRLLRLR
jgi:hypothetical protein